MKRLLRFAGLVVLFIAFFSSLNAQTTIIGTGSSITYSYPVNGYYNYGWANSIYLGSEINCSAGNLNSIALYVDNSPVNYVMDRQKIYVRHTTETTYNTSNYTGPEGFTLVYDGSITFNGPGWTSIVLNKPFTYNGSGNLEFLFENYDGTWTSGFPNFRTTTTGSGIYRTKRDYADLTFPLTNTTQASTLSSRPNIRVTVQPCTFNPGITSASLTSVVVGNSSTLSLTQQDAGVNAQWQSSTDNIVFKNISGATDLTYLATNLTQTSYFRAIVKNTSGCVATTNSVLVDVDITSLTTADIGTGIDVFDKYPFNGYYNFSWASMLYKASEINSTGKLSRISVYVDNSPVNETMDFQKIYVRHTTTCEYTDVAYPTTTGFTLVYDGSITYNGTGWKEIVLQKQFEYNGVDDLEFLFENRDGTWTDNHPKFRGQTGMPDYRVKRDYSDNSFPTVTTNTTLKYQNVLNIKMKFAPCSINGGTIFTSSSNVLVGNNVTFSLSGQEPTGTIQWEQSSDNISFKVIPNQSEITCTIPMTLTPLYVRTVTTLGCSKFSNVVTVTPDESFMELTNYGTGLSVTEKYPFNTYYNYSWSNILYTKDEVGATGKIASVSFKVTNSPVNFITNKQKIYVRHTTETGYSNATYSGTAGFTLVFDGVVTYNGTGWKEIPFTNVFDYDGTSNLEFLFENRDGSYGNNYPTFEYTSGMSTARVKRDYSDGTFPSSCITCSKASNVLNIKVKFLAPKNATGTVSASEEEVCTGETTTLSIEGQIIGSTLQWQSSSDNVTFVNIEGATSAIYTTKEITATTYFRAVVSKGSSSASGEGVMVKFNCTTKMIIDENSGLGSIEVDIAKIADKVGPYHYIISELPIPELTEEYHYVKDTIYGDTIPVDSVAFFRGDQEATKFNFENLPIGSYYIAVFDSRGIRIFDKQKVVQPVFVFETGSGLSGNGNAIVSTQNNAKGTLPFYLTEQSQGTLNYVLTDYTKPQYYGLLTNETSLENSGSLKYGFSVISGKIYTIENGVASTEFTVGATNMKLLLRQTEGNIEYFVDGKLKKSIVLPTTEYILKSGFGLEQFATSFSFRPERVIIKRYIFKSVIKNGNCAGTENSTISFGIKPTHFYPGNLTYHYYINNGTNNVASGNGVTSSTLPTMLPPMVIQAGVYVISGSISISGGSIPFSETVYIGMQTEWPALINYSLVPNSYSLKKSLLLGTAEGRSTNALTPGEIGWVKFEPVMLKSPNIVFSHGGSHTVHKENYFIFSQNSSSSTETYFTFEKINNTYYRIRANGYFVGSTTLIDNSYTSQFAYSAGTDIRVMIKATTIELWVNNVLRKTLARPNGIIRLKAKSLNLNDGFNNVVASFCPPIQTLATIGYTELKKEQTAGYALAVQGKVKFTFDEEYKIETGKYLPVKIYDDNHLLLVQSDINGVVTNVNPVDNSLSSSTEIVSSEILYVFDDNRYILTLSNITGITIGKYYTIEVLTSTGDKRFLRILYKS